MAKNTRITATTKLLGVIGYPIAHSLSPVMHNAAIAHLEADYAYLPFPVPPEYLEQAIAGFAATGVQGFNVTIPHKQAVIPFLSEISEIAQAVGAVNTVYRTERGWGGTNTDVTGFLAPLYIHQRHWNQNIAVVLGNGGAARAVVAGCAQLGCTQVQVVGRDRQKLEAFHRDWANSPLSPTLSVHLWEELPQLLPQADLLINTTPIGMHPHNDASPLTLDEMKLLKVETIAYDLIYTPRPTTFLQLAEKQGAIAIDGLEMLIQQGAAALQLWLGQPVPVEVMRRALKEVLSFEV
ncbi:shikimate dehydrogenase [Leptolyngbya sp. FACHB-541]|uniref:shikimate dehydrogenase n=1 Tax=Leptolyngbya sp. FACHB-541 TaxID=2692810 RepID=UPI00168823F5|nr:shikimate dehydrogenase [Leptolyngbya sp. FACHB-541]MBD1996194.1 shikimate dehydrogenase [Leptolyngbya sp. FACHB-541]